MTTPVADATRSKFSERVRTAPPPFFPDSGRAIRFNFDQGVPAPESYPIDELADYAARAIRSGGVAACGRPASSSSRARRSSCRMSLNHSS